MPLSKGVNPSFVFFVSAMSHEVSEIYINKARLLLAGIKLPDISVDRTISFKNQNSRSNRRHR